MKRFLAVYTGSPTALSRWDSLSDTERSDLQTKGIAAWNRWVEDNKSSILEMGGPLGRTKLLSAAGMSDIRNSMSGFTIVEAASQEAAAKLFLNHPHFTAFPGEGVEVMEIKPVPAM